MIAIVELAKTEDARVTRTREKVIAAARELLVQVGPLALTYTLLAERTGVTRQTLYRHWPTIEALLVDLVLVGPEAGYPEPGNDARTVAVGFLTSLRSGMNDPTTSAAFIALAAQAETHPASATAVIQIAADRRDALNSLLTDTGRQVTPDEFAGLCGPVFFGRFVARQPVPDQLIEAAVTAWLARPPS